MAAGLPIRRVVLVGFMGAGKTTVGRALSNRLGWPFTDLDDVVQAREGRSIAEIFAGHGESGFRDLETEALRELLTENQNAQDKGLVLALGGGAFLRPENREAITNTGALAILLEAPFAELQRRIALEGKNRPLAVSGDALAQLFATRQATYHLIQHRVQTLNKAPDEIAAEIESITQTHVQAPVTKPTKPEVAQ